ncbi:hypothetical protein, conserved [Angomonas deanei]|uniref:Uncharacterized protein n=1 Tax=Angomonas deanei TaxID=59799 RepID=A0A7G2CIC2_9TRYP|nr:hypothetical protein, conserved [Angomonas deanei]
MVPSKRVLLLRDGPAALSLIRYASTGLSCAPYCAANLAYSSLDMTGSQSDDWSDITLVYIGTWDEDHVYVPFPSLGKVSGDLSFYWARLAQWELCKQYRAYCSIAVLQTTGGGWASLRRVDKALECAVQLYYVAGVVGNDEIAQKCRIFVGWSCLWMGDQTSALLIFYSELASARRKKDIVHKRRCLHAIAHAKSNPNVLGTGVGSTTIMDEVLFNMFGSSPASH